MFYLLKGKNEEKQVYEKDRRVKFEAMYTSDVYVLREMLKNEKNELNDNKGRSKAYV